MNQAPRKRFRCGKDATRQGQFLRPALSDGSGDCLKHLRSLGFMRPFRKALPCALVSHLEIRGQATLSLNSRANVIR